MARVSAATDIRPAGEIIALARARRALELGRLPEWGAAPTPRFWQRIREREGGVSSGTLVAILRHAARQRQMSVAKEVFVALLERTEVGNAFWARQAVQRIAGLAPETARMMREDLRQELTLHLWEHLALREGEGWELFFRQSLAFARARVASRYLERHGYRPGQRVALFFSEIAPRAASYDAAHDGVGEPVLDALPLADSADRSNSSDVFSAADLADLRGYVERLPPRERAAVVMRYWQCAREHEIAEALGVTSRTVRNLLSRANARLYALYTGTTDAAPTHELSGGES
jgi:RNA polymerase sigma factor (sigma-70 family)